MKVGSLFSGIGGLELGLERAGMEVEWQVEIDEEARLVLESHWPGVRRYEDVNNVEGAADIDVLCGGFPCQDYSVAGQRGGLAGDRGALWWAMLGCVAEYKPSWVVGENVSGILTSNGGRDFRTIVRSLVEIGYGVCWTVLDSEFFGLPQRRRRLFIVGHSGGIPRPEVLALGEGLFGHPSPAREDGGQDTEDSRDSPEGSGRTAIGFHYTSVHHMGAGKPNLGPTLKVGSGVGVTGTASVCADGLPPRKLTPRECERLQGFPDGWTKFYHDGSEVSDRSRYRMLGNAVSVPVAEWIGRQIIKTEGDRR